MDGVLYTCTTCKGRVPSGQVRYDRDLKLVCLTCYEGKMPKKIVPDPRLRPLPSSSGSLNAKTVGQKGPAPAAHDLAKQIGFLCLRCKYRFKIRENSPRTRRCPYCGGEDVRNLSDVLPSAEELIREAMDRRFDR